MIIILDHYDSFVFNIIDHIKKCGLQARHAFYDKISIDDIKVLNPSHMILSPGPKHPSDAPQTHHILDFFKDKIPILGICLGHQIIAQTCGAEIIQTYPQHGIADKIFHDGKGLFSGLEDGFLAARYHSLSVSRDDFPDDLIIQAENRDHIIMAIKHKIYPIFGIQFHP
ncbi:MAG: aminodeoxychorismate/anthranilate synthase component II, partial [Pseudomonadota bacterium]